MWDQGTLSDGPPFFFFTQFYIPVCILHIYLKDDPFMWYFLYILEPWSMIKTF